MKESNLKNSKTSILGRTSNFISRISNGYILKASSTSDLINGLAKPDVRKALINKALKEKSLSKLKIDVDIKKGCSCCRISFNV